MIFQRLRETLYFFWHHLTELLIRLLPLLPLLAYANYRLLVAHDADPEQAMRDGAVLLPQMLAGIAATALAIRFTLAVIKEQDTGFAPLWRAALQRLLPLVVVQLLAGLAVVAGLVLLILPGLYLLGVLLPAYVIVMREDLGPLAALRAAWARFRPQVWSTMLSLVVVFSLLVVVLNGLEALGRLLTDVPLGLRVAALSGLDLIGVLFSQTVAILLVRVYEIEQAGVPKGGWN